MMKIRKATAEDLDTVESLYNDICDYLADKEFNPGWRKGYFPAREDAIEYLEADGLYLAEENGMPVGSIALSLDPDEKDILFIHTLVVHPDHLRHGYGTGLLRFAEQCAREQGLSSLRLHVYEKNSVAIQAYERNGYNCIDKVDIGLREYGLEWFYLYERRLDL